MTDTNTNTDKPKDIPGNLNELEQTASFKAVSDSHTIPALRAKLDEKRVPYFASDDKAETVWRYIDAYGIDFKGTDSDTLEPKLADENEDGNESDETNSDKSSDDSETKPATPAEIANNSAKTDTTPINPLDPSSSNQALNAADKNTVPMNPLQSSLESEGLKTTTPKDDVKPAGVKTSSDNTVTVYNKGAFDQLETASVTLLKAKQTTVIHVTPKVGKDKILRNIAQINRNRGNVLEVK